MNNLKTVSIFVVTLLLMSCTHTTMNIPTKIETKYLKTSSAIKINVIAVTKKAINVALENTTNSNIIIIWSSSSIGSSRVFVANSADIAASNMLSNKLVLRPTERVTQWLIPRNNISSDGNPNILNTSSIKFPAKINLLTDHNGREELISFYVSPIKPYIGMTVERDVTGYLIIKAVDSNSPAYYSGINVNDTLLSINNIRINSTAAFEEYISSKSPKDIIVIKVKHGIETKEHIVKIENVY